MPKRCALGCLPCGLAAQSSAVETHNSPISTIMDMPQPSTSMLSYIATSAESVQATGDITPSTVDLGISQPSTSTYRPIEDLLLEHNYFKTQINEDLGKSGKNVTRKKIPASALKSYKKEIKNLKTQLRRSRKYSQTFKSRLASAEKITFDAAFKMVTKKMTTEATIFTKMQYTQTHKAPSGRRFTLEEKILSLSLYKKSPKCYNLLSKYFTLPSGKTLKGLLSQIKIKYGVNTVVFDKIKETVQGMNPEDRLCSIIFDEMALSPSVNYDSKKDELKGFSDFYENKIADHVLVFMLKGIRANFKQPVAYYFTNNINKINLKNSIVDVIKKVQATGLIVLCTICDQGTANVSAINELMQDTKNNYFKKGKEWRHDIFEINKKQIIPLYDVPHLLKGLRNNLLTKDLKYIDSNDENKVKIVKWRYFQEVYSADKCLGELRFLHKLTEEHLIPEKIKKMRVKTAAQVFSHSVAVVTEHLSARGLIKNECRHLIPFVSVVDKLFDSFNSNTFCIPNGKVYKGCVRQNSPHHPLWQNAIKLFKSVKFIKHKKSGNKIQVVETSVPSVNNFIKTIEGMQLLWKILTLKYSFDSMLTRNLNQDPLENFFGNIRSYGVRNNSPNYLCFEGAFKSLLLNNFNSPHSIKANCEKDENTCLQNLHFLINNKPITPDVPEEKENNVFIGEEVMLGSHETEIGQKSYVCGWVLTKCLKNVIKGCKTCKIYLLTNNENEKNAYIKTKEYFKSKRWLIYPSEDCVRYFYEIQDITTAVLKINVPKTTLKSKIKLMVNTLVYFPSYCKLHDEKFKEYFTDCTINIIIYSWCRGNNRILCGKSDYNGDDEVKNIAKNYYNKHKNYRLKK